ncbi:MAG: ribosome-associated translation inhibitor RaiA [Oscillospiraceae bacterium]|jgi:putative sigma-54 modulation protein|nr:ribosome-associated translation inhibitor RaiA [Oscillospiraceae bacterium]
MNFRFHEKKVDVSDTLREYAVKKLGKLDKYFKNEAEATVAFLKEAGRYVVEVTIANEGLYFRSKENRDDMYAAIDSGLAAIERQIHKNKTRLSKRLQKGAFEREVPSVILEPIVEEEEDFPIVRVKRFDLKPMTPEEAILQMNLLSHEFYVFKNHRSGGDTAVVYKRKSGGYGLIEGA